MKKKLVGCCLLLAVLSMLLTACCSHEWKEANCGYPKTCTLCGKTKGKPEGEHVWEEANCTEAKNCSVCEMTDGEPLGHSWIEATCTEAKTCSVCGTTEGAPLGHSWLDATCTEPKTCSVCKETEGEALGHTIEEWNVVEEATCTKEGKKNGECTVCKATIEKKIKKKDHKESKWQIVKEATWNAEGERQKVCTKCSEVLKTESYEMSDADKEAAFKATCKEYTYDQVARNPDDYFLEHAVYTGEVIQVMEGSDGEKKFRIDITPTSWGYTDTIYVELPSYAAKRLSSRILEDDIVKVWGYNFSTVTYTTVLGAKVTIPAVSAEYMEVIG